MAQIGTVTISPAVINSSCAWASDFDQLQALYQSPWTGAVTTRTATRDGFQENELHTVAFTVSGISSLNSYGYSPHPLSMYLVWIESLLLSHPDSPKPFIISITASTAEELRSMLQSIQQLRTKMKDEHHPRIAIELNTSCPNIPGSPPKGYVLDSDALMTSFLSILAQEVKKDETLTVGLKLPPYVYREQFVTVVNLIGTFQFNTSDGLAKNAFAFFTCTNTLGNSLLFSEQVTNDFQGFAIPTAIGGLAGESLHALALGNVYTFANILREAGQKVAIIGVGGVTSLEAGRRMRKAGAAVVGCATLLGKDGVQAFKTLNEH